MKSKSTKLHTDNSRVCGISIARLKFFVDAGKPYANAYDITCTPRAP